MNDAATAAVSRAVAAAPGDAPVPRMLVAYSGGLDSTVLLHALALAHPGRVRAIHVHHGLHANADTWAAHCQRMCDAWTVPLCIAKVDVVDVNAGPEGAARAARHAAFQAHMQGGEWLALAHHRDDQAETFLLRALRGSGPDGLASMRPLRAFGAGMMWRPLLDLPRAMLHAYAQAHELTWIEDPSNQRSEFDRNFLRNEVLPLLRRRWPQADAAFARSALLCQNAHALLTDSDLGDLERVRYLTDARMLSVSALLQLTPERRARVLRLWVRLLGLPPLPHDAIRRIETELLPARLDAEPRYDWGPARMMRWRGILRAESRHPVFPPGWMRLWDGREPLLLPEGSTLALSDQQGFKKPVLVRPRLGGERIDLPHRTHSHALKKVLQERHMPPWERQRLPLLLDPTNQTVLTAGDRIISRHFDEWPNVYVGASLHWQLA